MTALHFAVRDHGPLVRIQEILEAYSDAVLPDKDLN